MQTNPQKIKVLLYGNIYRDYRSQILTKFLFDSGQHISIVCPDYYQNSRLAKIPAIDKLLAIFSLAELWLKAPFTDVIYLPPMNSRFIKSALLAAKLWQKQLIVEMYISIYDTFVGDRKLLKGKQIEPDSRQAKRMLEKDRLALTKADYIVHTSSHELTYWEKIFDINIDRAKVFIAPNCNVSNLVRHQKLERGVFEICWWGTFIPLHGLDNILQALKILAANNTEFVCNLFGVDNALFAKYTAKIRQYGLEERVRLRKDLSFADGSLPNYLVANCDLALGIFGNTDKAYNAVPNKLIEALSMGIPTLTMSAPALQEFFDPQSDLWTCEATPQAIAESINNIINGDAVAVDWEQTRQKVLNTFSVKRYREIVERVLATTANSETSKVEQQALASY
ncbi:glycosyltransferase [Myxosarcina sp. GI1]|uniref:glycosyltransferase n=1 Tax=Myxosarcina sp. GI1 TaxID=1541065 RepID=UPI0005656FA0|nr:glycosyltransferase [Myxosarcina sp. GI1]